MKHKAVQMRLSEACREMARLMSHYTTALLRESHGKPAKALHTLYELFLARLRYNVGPYYYSLFELAGRPRSMWGDFVTDDPEFLEVLRRMSPSDVREIADDKALFHEHCVEHRLP